MWTLSRIIAELSPSDHAICCHVRAINMDGNRFGESELLHIVNALSRMEHYLVRDALLVLKGLAPAEEAGAEVLQVAELLQRSRDSE